MIEVVKGGLILDLGVRGFLPASLVDIRRVQNLDEFMGQTLECKVIELNRSRNNVVLSRRAVLEEERKEVREQILGRLEPGQVVEGKISNIVDFGAFVDLDGHRRPDPHLRALLEPRQPSLRGGLDRRRRRVKVLDIDRDRQRISLGLKQTQEDPWQRVVDDHAPATCSTARSPRSSRSAPSSRSCPASRAWSTSPSLPSTTSRTRARSSSPGDELKVKILEVDEERRRLSLSIKRVEGQELPTLEGAPPPPPADGAARARGRIGQAEDEPGRGSRARIRVLRARWRSPGLDRRRRLPTNDATEAPAEGGDEAHEGETVSERPDSPDGEEAPAEES